MPLYVILRVFKFVSLDHTIHVDKLDHGYIKGESAVDTNYSSGEAE
jgi:hypothetical protein